MLIPVRNEAGNILELLSDLEKQTLPIENFEVWVINDASTDETAQLVFDFTKGTRLNLFLINLEETERNHSPKKRAITQAITQVNGEIIVTTDGDCRVGPDWLLSIAQFFEVQKPVFVSAPVLFLSRPKSGFWSDLWTEIQQIEFASLIVSGAVSMKMGFANMCSGANIAYLKSAFEEVNGFAGNEHLASGDDEFLMHKMVKAFPGRVKYLKSERAAVKTYPQESLKSFFHQRKRWAGKWSSYELQSPKVMAIFIFFANASWIYAVFAGNWLLFFSKLWPEFLFLGTAILIYRRIALFFTIPFVQLIYPFYVVFFGLTSLGKRSFIWKNRDLS